MVKSCNPLNNYPGEGHGNTLLAQLGLGSMGMDFESEDAYRDVAKLGTCDDGCVELAEMLGWKVRCDILLLAKHSQIF